MNKFIVLSLLVFASTQAFAAPADGPTRAPVAVTYSCFYYHGYDAELEAKENEAKKVPFVTDEGQKVLKKGESLGMWGKGMLGGGTKMYVWGLDNKLSISAVLMSAASLPGAEASTDWGVSRLHVDFPTEVTSEIMGDSPMPMPSRVLQDRIECIRN